MTISSPITTPLTWHCWAYEHEDEEDGEDITIQTYNPTKVTEYASAREAQAEDAAETYVKNNATYTGMVQIQTVRVACRFVTTSERINVGISLEDVPIYRAEIIILAEG